MAFGRRGRPQTVPTHEDPANFLGTLWEIEYVMREQAAAAHQMMD